MKCLMSAAIKASKHQSIVQFYEPYKINCPGHCIYHLCSFIKYYSIYMIYADGDGAIECYAGITGVLYEF